MTRPAGVAPAPGDPVLPSQQTRRVQREGTALADQMLIASGDPARMREALQTALDKCGPRLFGPCCAVALQALSSMIGAVLPGAVPPTSRYEGTP